jgi:hypothetical protein
MDGSVDGCSPSSDARDTIKAWASLDGAHEAVAVAAVRALLTRQARRELLFCLIGLPFSAVNPVLAFFVIADLLLLTHGRPGTREETHPGGPC